MSSRTWATLSSPRSRPARIRTWWTDRLVDEVGRSTVAKTYRILHAIFATAVDDDLVRRNPCRIKGADSEHCEERPTATLEQVFAIAKTIQPRYRLLVLRATLAQRRFGELVALGRIPVAASSPQAIQRLRDNLADVLAHGTPGQRKAGIETHVAAFKIDGSHLIPIFKSGPATTTGRPKHRPTRVFAQRITLWS
jgi:hypothetical protein